MDYDVIVVGAGNAALAAAVSARNEGAERVLVLEKAPLAVRGGNTHYSGALLRFAFDRPQDLLRLAPDVETQAPGFLSAIKPYPAEAFRRELDDVTQGQTDPRLSQVLISRSYETVCWMVDQGIRMFVWFGRERDGCSDLTITLVDFLSDVIEAGFAISITDTTANIGGITADSSFTRFYLSRDQTQSSNDLLLIGLHQVPSLGNGDSDTQTVTATVPAEANGDYFVIACADDTEKIDELTETNNCLASDEQLTVEGEPFIFVGDLTLESLTNPPRSGSPGGSFVVVDRVRFVGDDAPATVVRYYLDESRFMSTLSIPFDVVRPVPPFPIPLPNLTGLIASQIGQQLSDVNLSEGSSTLVIPLNTPSGSYFLIACADGADQFDELNETNNCRASDLPIAVGGGQGP